MTYKAISDEKTKFKRTNVLYAGNSSQIIWFQINRYQYILDFPLRGKPVLVVKNSEKTIAEMTCKGGWGGVMGKPEAKSEFIIDLPDTSPGNLDGILLK
ncbi:hypothetical protein GCM10027277_11060 [Pseudoduganella ginsengisoli]|uniref:Uncharacterized protein n=1 Tax=Pseudoduganella ginsengisoli TaxID=1462440 RepID=A0A6L6PXS0_9BURK|nr:hypothetical protein [Pseudoduganella ginsengisoli]MTW01502.1 hypothetical protein [Pseudoduganella ginsengisoli]